jgi:hypothetical protein
MKLVDKKIYGELKILEDNLPPFQKSLVMKMMWATIIRVCYWTIYLTMDKLMLTQKSW